MNSPKMSNNNSKLMSRPIYGSFPVQSINTAAGIRIQHCECPLKPTEHYSLSATSISFDIWFRTHCRAIPVWVAEGDEQIKGSARNHCGKQKTTAGFTRTHVYQCPFAKN